MIDDAELWERFRQTKIPAPEWTHRMHLRVAHGFLRRHLLDEAHVLMRVGIIVMNAAHGLVETPVRGYHETLTRTWLVLVASARRATPGIDDSRVFVDAHAERLGKDAPLRHYARERVFSVEARARFLEPDLAPFD